MNIIDYEIRMYFPSEPTEEEKRKILQEEYEKEQQEIIYEQEQYDGAA